MSEYNGFNVVGASMPPMKKITTVGKGSIPAALGGSYTSAGQAHKAIDTYLLTKKKVSKSDKTK